MEETTHCPICGRGCSLSHPSCQKGRDFARRQVTGEAYQQREYQGDYGQDDHGYDPEGLADPDAHNYSEDHVSRIRPEVKRHNWDLDSDEDFEGDSLLANTQVISGNKRVPASVAPMCPGCHLGCSLDDPSCGKGYDLQMDWQCGRELSAVRGQGGMRGDKHREGREGNLVRLSYLLDTSCREVARQTECLTAGRFLEMLGRQGHFMKFRVLNEKAHLDQATLNSLLPELERQGLIEVDAFQVSLTDLGVKAAEEASREADRVLGQVFGGLSAVEQEQLASLLHRLKHTL